MSAKEAVSNLNPNTILLTVLLAISGWTLTTLMDVKDTLVRTVVRVDNHDHQIAALIENDHSQAAAITDLRLLRLDPPKPTAP